MGQKNDPIYGDMFFCGENHFYYDRKHVVTGLELSTVDDCALVARNFLGIGFNRGADKRFRMDPEELAKTSGMLPDIANELKEVGVNLYQDQPTPIWTMEVELQGAPLDGVVHNVIVCYSNMECPVRTLEDIMYHADTFVKIAQAIDDKIDEVDKDGTGADV